MEQSSDSVWRSPTRKELKKVSRKFITAMLFTLLGAMMGAAATVWILAEFKVCFE